MLSLILIFLLLLWLLGYIQVPLTAMLLFSVFGRRVTLNDALVFLVILWLISLLPRPFQDIAVVFLLLWLLSFFGVIAIAGFSNLLMFALIIGLVAYLFHNRFGA